MCNFQPFSKIKQSVAKKKRECVAFEVEVLRKVL